MISFLFVLLFLSDTNWVVSSFVYLFLFCGFCLVEKAPLQSFFTFFFFLSTGHLERMA